MRGSFVGGAALAAAFSLGASLAAAGTINGTATFSGTAPAFKPLSVAAEPMCAKRHPTVPDERLVLGPNNSMANVMVRVVSGLPAGKTYPAPKDPVVMDQVGCQYVPHVIGLMVGQPLKVLNSDGVLHNVHALPKINKPFNMAMPPTRKEATESFAKEEGMFVVKCDVHPWMQSYVGVFSNPFFAVTDKNGKFTIANLPAGTYEIEAWHERLGKQKASVTVGASDTKTQGFTFKAPSK
jgi:plastocyanin